MTRILVTGGTGSLGKEISKLLLTDKKVSEVVVYSRNETEHFNMRQEIEDPRLKYIIGDVQDFNAIYNATIGVDYVIHAAAMKHIEIAEKNPIEATKTNVNGTINVVNSSIQNNVKKVLYISTDKACAPTSVYGISKLLAEKNIIFSNGISDTKFAAVRFGNIVGSNGSIFKKWKILKDQGKKVQVTDKEMTRFFISVSDAAKSSIAMLYSMIGGELFIPKMKSANIYDLANVITDPSNIELIGLRPGEKLHEDIVSPVDLGKVEELLDYYVVYSDNSANSFSYNSKTNTQWFSKEEIDNFFL